MMVAPDPKTKDQVETVTLQVSGLKKYFPIRNIFGRRTGWLKALDDVSFKVHRHEILGLVGESGCGKSTLGKTIMGIHQPMAGEIIFNGQEIGQMEPKQRRGIGKNLQYVYQDPGASLDPRWKIRRSLHEPLIIHTDLSTAERTTRLDEIMNSVGLPPGHLDLFPHELSGGQQRRVGLARILTLHPELVVLDEPTSGLDVSVQATVLKLFLDLQKEFSLTYIFISHDLSVVRMMCNRVAVMYLGKIVEIGETKDIFENPQHPYTRSLLSAIPKIGGKRVTDNFSLKGEPPDPGNLPSGCCFRTRCPIGETICAEKVPDLREIGHKHSAACHLLETA